MITLKRIIRCKGRTIAQGQKVASLFGARRVASTRFPKNKTPKMMAAEKKTNTLVHKIVVKTLP
jgi:hypothetical protein